MSRWATMLSLGGVAGFCGASALRLAGQAGLLDGVPFVLNLLSPFDQTVAAMQANEAVAFAALFAAVTIGAFGAIGSIAGGGALAAGRSTATLRFGEAFAGAALSGLIAFYMAAAAIGSPVVTLFGAGPGFLFAMALCFAALLFDRMMEVVDDGGSDAGFEAALENIRAAERETLRDNWRGDRSRDPEVR